jgi:hypothetical protein
MTLLTESHARHKVNMMEKLAAQSAKLFQFPHRNTKEAESIKTEGILPLSKFLLIKTFTVSRATAKLLIKKMLEEFTDTRNF